MLQNDIIDVEHYVSTSSPTSWISDLSLSSNDKHALVCGEWLSDSHIEAAHIILRKMYPRQNGLQNTLVLQSQLSWRSSDKDFVQIVHISNNHWVCVSNRWCPPGVCDVYDSLAPSFCSSLITQIKCMVNTTYSELIVRYIDVQYQRGQSDCGLFATAFAEALCKHIDPNMLTFNQDLMREHLKQCYEKQEMTSFPAAIVQRPKRSRSRVKALKFVKL